MQNPSEWNAFVFFDVRHQKTTFDCFLWARDAENVFEVELVLEIRGRGEEDDVNLTQFSYAHGCELG